MDAAQVFQCVVEATREAGPGGVAALNGSSPGPEALIGCLERLRQMVGTDLDGALRALGLMLEIVDSDPSASVRSRARSVRAHALNYANRFDEAVASGLDAARIAAEAGDDLEAARARVVLVHSFARLGRFGEALEQALRAERSFVEAGETELAVRAVTNAGIVTRMQGNAADAIEMFDRALRLRAHEPATEAQIENCRAEALLDAGRFADAEAGFLRSIRMLEGAGVSRIAAIVRGNLADLYGRQGRLSAAIEQFESARRFFESDQAYGDLGRILAEQADVYAMTGLSDDAIVGYRRAEELLEKAGLVAERARALIGLGRMLAGRDPHAAASALNRAAALHAETGNSAGRAVAELHRARLEVEAGDLRAAQTSIESAAVGLSGRRTEALLCEIVRADVLLAEGRHADAARALTEALPDAKALGLPIHLAEILARRAAALGKAGELGPAVADAREAIDLIERVRGTLRGSRFRAGLIGGSRGMYEDAVDLLLRAGALIEAFEVTERARGRTLLDLLGGGVELDAAAESEDEGTRRLLRLLIDARAELNAVYAGLDPTSGGATHAAWLERVHATEDRVTSLETRLHASRRGRELLGVPEPFGRIAAEIAAGQALVSYWSGRDGLVCLVVRDGRVETVRIEATPADVEEAVQAVLFQMRRGLMRGPGPGSERRLSACVRALGDLHEMVWAPLEGHLDGIGEVAVVPAGPLHAVPFSALHDGSGYLIERVEPVLLPTASVLPLLRGQLAGGGEGVSVIAAPDRIAPEIEAEAWAVRDALPGAEIVVGVDATGACARERASRARVLHLACHGAFPPSNPLAAGLKLADGWITVRDVLSWRLPGSVVVLSGCDTGRSTAGAGEELFGFGRGFLAAGARGLVMSLWSAHDATTRGLMSEMYRALEGDSGRVAVRRALVSAQRSQIGAGIHPAFWSNFVYLGV